MTDDNPTEEFSERIESLIGENTRLGTVPGAGPKGAKLLEYDDLPDDPEALKGMYLELQRAVRDLHSIWYQERQEQRMFSDDEEELRNLISIGYTRASEIFGIFTTILFIAMLLIHGTDLPTEGILSGAIAGTLVFDRWVRPQLS